MNKRGRIKGQGKGTGAIQIFIRQKGGREYLKQLYEKTHSADGIADYIFKEYGLYCCANSIRNALKHYKISIQPSGGDRRSLSIVEFRRNRFNDCN